MTHQVLPRDAIAELKRAAQTPNTAADPQAREKAIDDVTRRIKRNYPLLFR